MPRSGRRPAARTGRAADLAGAVEREVVIERLGAAGDGIARLGDATFYVPFALPAERWRVRILPGEQRARPLERLSGPPRPSPPCPHFGRCGGCALQHLDAAAYAAFKRARILEPLARLGLEPAELLPTAASPPGSRRRLRLAFAAGRGGTARLGFRVRASRVIEPVRRCPIARPELEALLVPLAGALGELDLVRRAGAGEVVATRFEAGVDLLLLVEGTAGIADRERLAALARGLDLARLALGAPGGPVEPVTVRRPPRLSLGAIAVEPPPGAFLQATEEGERALAAAVDRWVPEGARLVDLYAGLGALSLPHLPRLARLELVEGEAEAVAALERALAGRPRVCAVRRDLARDPLRPGELAAFDAVLLDPPRAGAAGQCAMLARSAVPRIVYASCDPGSFARDARTLATAGFRLVALQPVDQFLWSAEVELVALFLREGPRPPAAA